MGRHVCGISQAAQALPPFYVMEVMERAQALERAGHSIIHLEVGEPDFPTPPHICEAASRALCAGETKYTHSLGLLPLREAIVARYNDMFGLDLRREQVIVTSGTSPAMLLLFIGILDPGDEVVMSNPHYACYPNFVLSAGGRPAFVYTREDEGFRLEPAAVRKAITSRTKAVLINSPANPTGRVMRPEEYRGICEAAGDIPVISDEIYQGLIYEGRDHSILEYTDNAFVLNGFSKLYAMTGWRLGYLIAPQECVRGLQKLQQNLFISANSFVQHGGVAALTGPQDSVRAIVAEYGRRRRYMLKRLREIGFGIAYEPEGAFYILANARGFGADSLALSKDILENAGVACTPGIDFGKGAEGYLRFSYSNSLENIAEGMRRLETYFGGKATR